MLFEKLLGVLPALADPVILIGVPGPTLVDKTPLTRQVQEIALARDALAIHHVKLGPPERWRHLVLDDLDAHPAAGGLIAIFDLADPPDIQADGGIKFERIAAGGRLRIAHEDADLLPELIDEDHGGVGLAD